jgi:hypothetical protein
MNAPLENLARQLSRQQCDSGYEKSDANPRPVARAALLIVAMVAVSAVFTAMLFDYFTEREGLVASVEADFLPPQPRLQVSAGIELIELRAREAALLSTYGWVDEGAGVVRLPVERAMEMALRKGFAVRAEVPDAAAD